MPIDLTISDEERKVLSTWTELDGDLEGCDPKYAQVALGLRLLFGRGDRSRAAYWENPEGIDLITDIDYAGDGIRAHKLDLYLPHDAVVRGGKTTPVYIDIHGGGFMYGHKELNRNFNTHLAQKGFAVFSLNYRPAPETDFLGQLTDIEQGFAWIAAHLADYPVDPNSVFITGDSAGGTLGLYSVALERSEKMAKDFGIAQAGLNLKGGAFISGLFDLTDYMAAVETPASGEGGDPTDIVALIAPFFFKSIHDKAIQWADLNYLVANVDLPPLFLNTSNDDFIQFSSLQLAMMLSQNGKDFEIHDRHTKRGESLGHVYPVGMSWLEESQETLQQIKGFSYNLI
ncbi:alpha/beta hydrolase [Bifidobacterium sp. ESL0732]|uniref:alpha/beta hydrolase n=1 Tax=Bifidobacterium sp. ESL0732 TaxID=2983222 RepID=UPI0023FA3822|nr:alpha/beta hydrolase [Bifidobacterium sp. ESL0732]WEV63674.1 alpha/beta hydrolase [Bifidobacterium sp. ESL0732]